MLEVVVVMRFAVVACDGEAEREQVGITEQRVGLKLLAEAAESGFETRAVVE